MYWVRWISSFRSMVSKVLPSFTEFLTSHRHRFQGRRWCVFFLPSFTGFLPTVSVVFCDSLPSTHRHTRTFFFLPSFTVFFLFLFVFFWVRLCSLALLVFVPRVFRGPFIARIKPTPPPPHPLAEMEKNRKNWGATSLLWWWLFFLNTFFTFAFPMKSPRKKKECSIQGGPQKKSFGVFFCFFFFYFGTRTIQFPRVGWRYTPPPPLPGWICYFFMWWRLVFEGDIKG